MLQKINWPLNDSNFSILDRIRIASFFLDPRNYWTQSVRVREFESKMAQYVGCKYAVFTSSGSTANTILAMSLRDRLKESGSKKNKVVFPSTTWTTSVSPFIREGFEPVFIDINFKDLAMDLDKLAKYLEMYSDQVACVFITSLLGFVPDIEKIKAIKKSFDIEIMMDNCENTFGEYKGKNVSSFFTSTTSTYFGHQLQSVEGGFLFTNDAKENDYFLMARNHGMTRSVSNPSVYNNSLVDNRFDFNFLGNNFRNTDINAYIGLQDFKRIDKLKAHRIDMYNLYRNTLNTGRSFLPEINSMFSHVPFCLPVFCESVEQKNLFVNYCHSIGVETRPIISGNLLRQTCYRKYADYNRFHNSEFLNNHCFYVGLHGKTKADNVLMLTEAFNKNFN